MVSDATDAPTSLLPTPANAGSVARTTKTVRTEREDVAQDARVTTLASVSVEISTAPGINPVPEMVTVLPTNGATLMKAGVSRTVMVMVMMARR